jgi:hypothetical protein
MSDHLPDCDVNDRNPDGIVKPCNCAPFNYPTRIRTYPDGRREWTDDPQQFRLTVTAIGETKEEAIRHALNVIGGILVQAGTDYSCGSTTGGARAEWEELQ